MSEPEQPPTADPSTTVILCHGAWGGPWVWEPVIALLPKRADLHIVVPDLPATGDAADGEPGTFADDVAVITTAIEQAPGPVVLVAHSMAGAAVTQAAADRPAVAHLIYVAAFVPDIGQTCLDQLPPGPLPASIVPDPAGRDLVHYRPLDDDLLNGCTVDTVEWATPRWRAQRLSSALTPITAAAWRDTPSTYLRPTNDNGIPPRAQNVMAARASAVVDAPAGHYVLLSHPQLVAELLDPHLPPCR